ncbi:DegV family protein [Bacillus songklensis]|uniref:DegV family protein n=1 Tax=Bacillus songklensis TaxID=1069116 RepID=A0ABV8B5Q2_9BACI
MAKIKIVTDSTVDLSKEELEQYGIEVVPLSITIDNDTFLDGIDITAKEFIERMRQSKELPKSSQPAAGQFVEVYEKYTSEGYDIVSIHMTGGMSGTVRSAESAANMVDGNVKVIDSMYISKALSFQVIEAAKMAQEGKTVEDIAKRVDEIRRNTTLYVVVDTLENLIKGGRIGRGKALIGSLLNIKPIASLEDGVYTPEAKVRSHSQVIKYLTKKLEEDTAGKTIKGIGLVHAEGLELAEKLKQSIINVSGYTDFSIQYTTPVISTHTGAGAIGFMYFAE